MSWSIRKKKTQTVQPIKTTISQGFIGILKIAAKHFPVLMGAYLMGYFNVSTAWIIGIVGLTSLCEHWRKERDFRMSVARATIMCDENEVILPRVADNWFSGLFFGGFDRAEWLNKVLKQVWPYLGHYVPNIIVECVEPGIRESLQAYKLGGFKLDKISLGTVPLRVGGVKVYEENVSSSEITMDVRVFYAGDCDIGFSVMGFGGGVKDFQLSGMLRVILKPLMTQMPLVGGFQLYFLNSPTVDFNLTGVARVFSILGLSGILRRVILDQLGAYLVLPNKLSVQLPDIVPPQTRKKAFTCTCTSVEMK